MPRKIKTREEITKANLAKTLSGMKKKVAEKEEIWLDLLNITYPSLVDSDMSKEEVERRTELAVETANRLLDAYEERWG